MSDTIEMQRVREEMKSIMKEFNLLTKNKSKEATELTKARIIEDLKVLADKFAKKYGTLQSKYIELMFHQNLEEIVGKGKAELFLKVQALRDAAENN